MPVPGIHHVTAITGDVQRIADFHVGLLGLRLLKKTVNFDVPDTYHVYFGDQVGTPGSAITFFGWPFLPWRRQGNGQVGVISYAVPATSIGFWEERLRGHGLEVHREERFGAAVLAFSDAEGFSLELVGEGVDDRWIPWPDSPVAAENQIRGLHSVALNLREAGPSARFLVETLGFKEVGNDGGRLRYAVTAGRPGGIVDLVSDRHGHDGEEGLGTVHHVAWRALDGVHQRELRGALVAAGREVTPVIDRKYFQSIYFREPGGVLFEIATDGPGFTVDESEEELGRGLQLPPHAEDRRGDLNLDLPPIVIPGRGGPRMAG